MGWGVNPVSQCPILGASSVLLLLQFLCALPSSREGMDNSSWVTQGGSGARSRAVLEGRFLRGLGKLLEDPGSPLADPRVLRERVLPPLCEALLFPSLLSEARRELGRGADKASRVGSGESQTKHRTLWRAPPRDSKCREVQPL